MGAVRSPILLVLVRARIVSETTDTQTTLILCFVAISKCVLSGPIALEYLD